MPRITVRSTPDQATAAQIDCVRSIQNIGLLRSGGILAVTFPARGVWHP